MTEKYTLDAEKREDHKHSARSARQAGRIPAVIYGYGVESMVVTVDYSTFLRTFRKTKQSSLIDLTVDGKKMSVLVHQYDLDPVKDTFKHVDFLAVNLKENTVVRVPLVFVGESPAVKNLGGTFISNHSELEIRCLPTKIPQTIEIDIATLVNLHEHITITDLNLPDSLEVIHLDPKTVLCTVAGRAVEEVEGVASSEAGEGEKEVVTEDAD